MKEFLESNDYKMWKQEENTLHFQKRVDDIYQESPVCKCNDKLFINIQVFTFTIHGVVRTSCEMNMVHERPDDEWCDLKIYSLTEDQVKSNLKAYEDKMAKLWEVFYA